MIRILITGSRTWRDREQLRNAINQWAGDHPPAEVTIVQGGARGADLQAVAYAHLMGYTVETHEARWRPEGIYNRRAGIQRNQHMVDLGADVCLAFIRLDSAGATHCAGAAKKAGIQTIVYRDDLLHDDPPHIERTGL